MRSNARENAFKIIFDSLFHEVDESLSQDEFAVLKKEDDIKFFNDIVENFKANNDKLKEEISSNLKNFEFDRLFKVDLAIIYLMLTEIRFCGTPKAIAINEGLELAKKYSTDKSHKFINGLISAILEKK